jgi:hypothetical protein
LQQEFEAAGIEIPEEIERLSATVMLSTHVKQVSLSRQFSFDEVTDMAKAAAAKFGKILSFETRYWPCTSSSPLALVVVWPIKQWGGRRGQGQARLPAEGVPAPPGHGDPRGRVPVGGWDDVGVRSLHRRATLDT